MLAFRFKGIVQGVGFRPFVYRICNELHINGAVCNSGADTIIYADLTYTYVAHKPKARFHKFYVIESNAINAIYIVDSRFQVFWDMFFCHLPCNAKIDSIQIQPHILDSSLESYNGFCILESKLEKISLDSALPKDLASCEDCLNEIFTPTNRHFLYHLTSCTNCGARYSIIDSLPYDRKNTAMKDFALCKQCEYDYHNPMSRYYHAQPISCNECAIELVFYDNGLQTAYKRNALESSIAILKSGQILCLKGLGGFALVCDARNKATIQALRKAKNRPKKPFAIMAKDYAMASQIAHFSPKEKELLTSQIAPIILAKQNLANTYLLALESIAPNLSTIGVLLANTPLHHILFREIDFPLIYTSANLESQPIITDIDVALESLSHISAYFLDFTRAIFQGVDDSIFRLIDGETRALRMARGAAPEHIQNPNLKSPQSILALGAQDKNQLCISKNGDFILSPYIGDTKNLATQERLFGNLDFLARIYDFTPEIIVSDYHPRYETTLIATNLAQTPHTTHIQVYHHYAHFYAILAEIAESRNEEILGIIWDGSGLGENGDIWGGEFLYGGFNKIHRVGHFQEFLLIGGEVAIKDIRRIGYALALKSKCQSLVQIYENALPQAIITMAQKHINTPKTTSVGRIFDGIAHILGILEYSSYEGEAGALLEELYYQALEHNDKLDSSNSASTLCYRFEIIDGVIYTQEMLCQIHNDIASHLSYALIALKFIRTLAYIALEFSIAFLKNKPNTKVGFSGGVFQNKALCEEIALLFTKAKIPYSFHTLVPTNDSGISFGQAAFAAYQHKE